MTTDQSKSLYQLLGVEKTASQADIKKAYRVLCLQLHPDKNPGDEEAKAKFQSLQKVYAILGDPDKRATYDRTGITDEDLAGSSSEQLFKYFSQAFRKVTEDDLDSFFDQYRGSDEELKDLLSLYTENKGRMDEVFMCLMCSDESQDSHRFMDAIREAIKKGDVKEHKSFKSWCKEVEQRPRPSDPLKKRSSGDKTSGARGDRASLALAIRENREKSHNALLEHLEAKYGGKGKALAKGKGGKRGAPAPSEPTDEEFEAIQKRLLAGRGKAQGKAATATDKKGRKRSKSDLEEEDLEKSEGEDEGDLWDEEESESGMSEESDSGSEEGDGKVNVRTGGGGKGSKEKPSEPKAGKGGKKTVSGKSAKKAAQEGEEEVVGKKRKQGSVAGKADKGAQEGKKARLEKGTGPGKKGKSGKV